VTKAADWLQCEIPSVVPVLPLKSTVLFPGQVASVQVDRKPSLGVFVDPERGYSGRNLGRTAVACRVLHRVRISRGVIQVVMQGIRRVRLDRVVEARPYFRARVSPVEEPDGDERPVRESLVATDERYPEELVRIVQLNVDSPSRCADLVAGMVQFGYADKRKLLETPEVPARLALLGGLLLRAIARARLAGEVEAKTRASIDRRQREAFLREQLEVIRHELDELDPAEVEIAELTRRVDETELPPEVAEEVRLEVQRLHDSNVRAWEGSTIRSYVDWVLSLPWTVTTKDRLGLRRARQAFDDRYLGHESAKRRILEFLAVRKLGGTTRSSLLAILGPPGTGRGSIARTVAEVLGRGFVRISLRGLHDEAEIRGRPRTDLAGRPGRILDGLREAGTRNPVVLIEKIDLLEEGVGQPMHALVEALDPESNHRFLDHYLGVPFDLSKALFVVTANVEEDLPEAIQDHVDVIELVGYTEKVKVAIAREYIWPRAVEAHGLAGRRMRITDAAMRRVIRRYTNEAGVRILRNRLETVCRRAALKVAARGAAHPSITVRNLEEFLGPPVYPGDPVGRAPRIGVATGLAWTDTGGDLLPVEALSMPGEGRTSLTGLLGEVLQESAEAALSYVRSQAGELRIPADTFKTRDLHIHFPEAAIPKDGPSAGIAVATAIASALSGRPVRHDVAMTGEISLRGRVLPVGGLHEKVLAAYRAGIRHVIVPRGNERDLAELPGEISSRMRLHEVGEVAEVLRIALVRAPKAT